MNLNSLLEHCRRGDELAWEAVVRQYQGRVYGLSYHYLGSTEDARDLVQEVFIRIYQNISHVPDAEGFLPWVIRITRNACIDQMRRKKARPPARDLPAEEMIDLPVPGKNPEEQCGENLRRKLVYRALRELTDLSREIIMLKEIQELSLEDIASMLKIPLGTVKSRSNRARIELARKLAELGAGVADNSAV